jgi:hypothetical protein
MIYVMVAVLTARTVARMEDPQAIFLIALRILATYGPDAGAIMDERVANLLRHHDVEAAEMWRLVGVAMRRIEALVAEIKAEVSASA